MSPSLARTGTLYVRGHRWSNDHYLSSPQRALCAAAIAAYVVLYLTNVPGSRSDRPELRRGRAASTLATVPAAERRPASHLGLVLRRPNAKRHELAAQDDLRRCRPTRSCTSPSTSSTAIPGCATRSSRRRTGTVGGTFQLNGKTVRSINPNTASHVFAIPQIGPLGAASGRSSNAKNPCGNAPCSLSTDHATITFTFRTPGQGPLPLAVLRAVRRRLHRGLRRADADRRLHGRLPEGCVRDARLTEPPISAASRSSG